MKPFDLTRALAGDPVITRDGRQVTELHHFKTAKNQNNGVFAIIDGEAFTFDYNGKYLAISSHIMDLFMAPKKRTIWVNVYGKYAYCHETKEIADIAFSNLQRLNNRAYPVEIEE